MLQRRNVSLTLIETEARFRHETDSFMKKSETQPKDMRQIRKVILCLRQFSNFLKKIN